MTSTDRTTHHPGPCRHAAGGMTRHRTTHHFTTHDFTTHDCTTHD